MKKLKFTIVALAALAVAACTVDKTETIEATRRIEITADLEETRTELGATGKFLWSPGDVIGVFGQTTQNAKFVANNKTSATNVTFSGEVGYTDTPKYCYYPYVNGATNVNAVPLSLQNRQMMTDGIFDLAANNPRMGTITKLSSGKYQATTTSYMSYMKLKISAAGTDLYGMQLDKVTLKLDGAALTGNFTGNLATKTITPVKGETYDYAQTVTQSRPYLLSAVTANMMIYPDIPAGSEVTIEIQASDENGNVKIASFKRKFGSALKHATTYSLSLPLNQYELTYATPSTATAGQITEFKFEAARNAGKILSTELYYNSSSRKTTTRTSTGVTLDIDQEQKSIEKMIPYLFDRNLVATFTATNGTSVYVGATKQESGVTVNDFSQPVVYRVVSNEGTDNEIEVQYVVTLTNSGLPVVVIDQSTTMPAGDNMTWSSWDQAGLSVRPKDSEWADDDMLTIYNADGSIDLNASACGIRLRGNTSQEFPKKPFAVKFDKKQSVLGMPAHKRWCLLANWIDRTGIRNSVAVAIANQTKLAWEVEGLEEGLTYNPRGQHVEVVFNGRHLGNYLLCEQIKIDGNRVNIQKEYDEDEPKGTAAVGYLIEFDDGYDENCKFLTDRHLPCQLKDDVPSEHLAFVEERVKGIENNIKNGKYAEAYKNLDIYSVIDQWFVFELAMNDEYKHPKSVYYYMDGDAKLKAGPIWDFDWQTFPNYDYVNSLNNYWTRPSCTINEMLYSKASTSGWSSTNREGDKPYMWYPLLVKDATFKAAAKARWNAMKPYLLQVAMYVDQLAEENRISIDCDKAIWPMSYRLKSSHAYSGDENQTFDEAIQSMQEFLVERINVMDKHFNAF